MTIVEQKNKAKEFAEYWKGKGYEKGESQKYWLSLLSNVYGIKEPEKFIIFEDQVHLDHTSFIDGFIPTTHVLIEQKGLEKDLRKPIKQSDGTLLNPFQQAKRYAAELPYSQRPRWIVTCNFSSFLVYDMENPNSEPEEILLENLDKEYYRLQFLVEEGNEHLKREMDISIKAGELVGKIYDEILKQYKNPGSEESLKSLNMLCVRLVFCLYAEDAGLFGKKNIFHDYLARFEEKDLRKAIIELFKVLDTKPEDRDPYMEYELAQFPYVNGGLFANEDIEIPNFTEEAKKILLSKASEDFDWSEISPTIFGAVFESTLNPETRRAGGMHYTSIENIHKVIDPLFLDELKEELEEIKNISVIKTRKKKLEEFQNKLASLKFLDPACGSGNFLTETYLSLRRLENEVVETMTGGQIILGDESISPIKVSISQFYGIEINDFAVTVATTALWIAESQMMKETEAILHINLDFLPLKSYTNIIEGNALRLDWNDLVLKHELNYIMGNPPFVGKKYQTKAQKEDMKFVFGEKYNGLGNLDYVTAWYKKSTIYMKETKISCAFVSTNSIVQGEQVPLFWKDLINKENIIINFAHQTFKWNSEAKEKAAVHCVIIGFGYTEKNKKKIYINNSIIRSVKNIHPYLIDMPNIFVENRAKPISADKALIYGSFALDNGNYTIDQEEYNLIMAQEPQIMKYIKPFIGSKEFINGLNRYCIWLVDADIKDLKNSKVLTEKIKNVKEWRSTSERKETLKAAEIPALFAEIRQPESDYLAIPITSSERRRYIPIGYLTKDVIASNHLLVLPNSTEYDFGILTSNVHMAWMRVVAGRLKSDYNYSARVVYNNFPWPKSSKEQKEKIENTARNILEARKKYNANTLNELYDPLYMPKELLIAHQENDRAVMEAYGFPIKNFTESMCVAELMKMYQELLAEK